MSGPKNSRHSGRRGSGTARCRTNSRRGDDAVGALLLQAGHAAQGLVGDVLPQTRLADLVAAQRDGAAQRALARPSTAKSTVSPGRILRSGWSMRRTRAAVAAGHGHPPREQVVDAGAPQHAPSCRRRSRRCCRRWCRPRRWWDRWRRPGPALGRVLHGPLGDHAGLDLHHLAPGPARRPAARTRARRGADPVEPLGVDHHAAGARAGTAPPVSPVPAPRGMAESPSRPMAASERRHLVLLGAGSATATRQVQAPVGGVGGVATPA